MNICHEESKTNSRLHNGLLDLMNHSTCFGHYYAHRQELATIQMASAYGSSPWLWQVAGLVHGCRFLERPVRVMFHDSSNLHEYLYLASWAAVTLGTGQFLEKVRINREQLVIRLVPVPHAKIRILSKMRDVKFSQKCSWRFESSGMWCSVTVPLVPEFSTIVVLSSSRNWTASPWRSGH